MSRRHRSCSRRSSWCPGVPAVAAAAAVRSRPPIRRAGTARRCASCLRASFAHAPCAAAPVRAWPARPIPGGDEERSCRSPCSGLCARQKRRARHRPWSIEARGVVSRKLVRRMLAACPHKRAPAHASIVSHTIPATLIRGDGIGPEIVDATLAALQALGAPFEWDSQVAGLEGVRTANDPLPQATLDSIRRTRLALKGPLETPSGGGYRSSNVRLREEFKLYANLRPVRTLVPGGRFENVDLVVVRENLEGLYIGHEHYVQIDDDPHAVAMATGINTRQGSRRLLEFAFEHAIATGRRKVTIVHKANILKALTGIFLETGLELYESRYKGRFVLDA